MMRVRITSALAAVAMASVAGLAVLTANPLPAFAIGPTVNGAGSTWVQIALDQWRADIARQGYQINYQGVGSSAGRQFFIINQVDFAASEIPFYPSELQQLQAENKQFEYIPDVAGGTSLMYNLKTPSGEQITNLRLDADAAGKIFTGVMTSWQDPEIKALNPGLQISETTINPVIRSDGSGTSAQFSLYLANQAPSVWNAFANQYGCPAPCSVWPPFNGSTQQSGSDGVANFVANPAVGDGAIGYVEAGYAFGRGFPIAWLQNRSGNFIPGRNDPYTFSQDVSTALKHATLNADLTQNLVGVYNAPESNAYPMSSYSYLIAQTTGFDPAKGDVLGTWLIYIACGGQREATPLGYSPLPPNLIQDVFTAEQRIPGAPKPPPIDATDCPNPTLTGTGGGGGGGNGGSGGSGGGGNGGVSTTGASSTTGATGQTASTGASTGLGGTDLGPEPASVATLSPQQAAASFVLAEQAASREPLPPSWPLFAAAAAVLVAVLAPALMLRRRGR